MRSFALSALAMLLLAPASARAAPIRVLAATELRIEPELASDGAGLDVHVQLRDDREHALPGERIRLTVSEDSPAAPTDVMTETTDTRGVATFHVATFHIGTGPDVRVYRLRAAFDGDGGTSGSQAQQRVDLDEAFVTLSLSVPGTVERDSESLEAQVTVTTTLPRSPQGLEVALLADERTLAGPVPADAGGHVLLRARVADLGLPGVHTLRAEHQERGATVSSPSRRLILRAATTLTFARVASVDGVTVAGALVTRAGPVIHEPVRVLWHERVVGAALTDDHGEFALALDPDVLGRPGVSVRAVFAPSEPWFAPSSSAPLVIAAPDPKRVRWTWVGAPVVIALALFGLARLRRLGANADQTAVALAPIEDANVERVATVGAGQVRVAIRLYDRATRAAIAPGEVIWKVPALGVRSADEAVNVPAGGRFVIDASAPGYAPRSLAGELPRGGEYAVRVPLRGWREELFDRLRRWMRQAGATGSPVLPTPRDVLSERGAPRGVEEFITFVESGTYGTTRPDAQVVREADALAQAIDAGRRRER